MRVTESRFSTSSSSASDSSSDSQIDYRRAKPHRGKYYRQPRESVAPMSFCVSGSMSMKQWLTEYEAYFVSKYEGSERQCAQKLGDFLDGSAKQAYLSLDGPFID